MTAISTPPAAAEFEDEDIKLIAIPQLVGFLRWIEELVVALSGYGVMVALGIGVIDLLSGANLSDVAAIPYIYAVSMAVGITGQLIALAARSGKSFNRGQWGRGLAYSVLVAGLAAIEYESGIIFGYHQAFGTSVLSSLAAQGISQSQFIQGRVAVAVVLAVLSGYLRYSPQRRKSLAQLRADDEYKAGLAELDARRRARAIGGLGATLRAGLQEARNVVARRDSPDVAPTEDISDADSRDNLEDTGDDPYSADDPRLAKYHLPEGVTLATVASMSKMASLLGIPPRKLAEAWDNTGRFTHRGARPGQPANTRNIAAWQVLSLCDLECLETPQALLAA